MPHLKVCKKSTLVWFAGNRQVLSSKQYCKILNIDLEKKFIYSSDYPNIISRLIRLENRFFLCRDLFTNYGALQSKRLWLRCNKMDSLKDKPLTTQNRFPCNFKIKVTYRNDCNILHKYYKNFYLFNLNPCSLAHQFS